MSHREANLGELTPSQWEPPSNNLTLAPFGESDFRSDSNRTIGPQKSGRVARDGFFTSPSAVARRASARRRVMDA